MISDCEREDVWTFLDPQGNSLRASVLVIDYPDQAHRSVFLSGVLDDGRLLYFEDGRYVCDDGTVLVLPSRQ